MVVSKMAEDMSFRFFLVVVAFWSVSVISNFLKNKTKKTPGQHTGQLTQTSLDQGCMRVYL